MIGGKDLLDRVGRSFGAAGVGDRVVVGVVGRGEEAAREREPDRRRRGGKSKKKRKSLSEEERSEGRRGGGGRSEFSCFFPGLFV